MTRPMIYILSTQIHHQKIIFGWLMYNAQSILVLMQVCMLALKVYVFSEQRNQTPMKMNGPSDPAFKTTSRLLTDGSASQNTPAKT